MRGFSEPENAAVELCTDPSFSDVEMRFEARPRPSVLIVDDDRDLADLYATWLRDDYYTRVAYSGEDALAELHTGIDVVLLDRRLPDISGDEVLVTLRDRGMDCRVAMVSAVTPDFDIIDLGFDDYLTKPVGREALHRTVERLVEVDSYDALHIRLSSLRILRNVLREEKSKAELAANERFQDLEKRIAELEAEITDFQRAVGVGIG
jgi:DNA-binding response OmpR family regulator